MRRPKTITIRLTEQEAEGLLNAGNRGVEDLYDEDSDDSQEAAIHANVALEKLGAEMQKAWPTENK